MRHIFTYFLTLGLILLCSCNNRVTEYTISGWIKDKKGCDSVYLYGYEQHHNKLMLLNKQKVVASSFVLTGACNEQVAFIQFKGDTIPYYLVLDTTPIRLDIIGNGYKINGSEENKEYFKYLQRRQNILNEKTAIWSKYMRMVADSTLNDSIESVLKNHNDILIDSLERMTIHYIDKKTTSSIIVENQFGNYITVKED